MIWLVLRRQRAALLLALALVAPVAVALVVLRSGAPAWATEQGMAGCPGRGTPRCPGEDEIEAWLFSAPILTIGLILWLLPWVVGIVAGASLFGREFDHGTHVFALAQSIGRLRWWATGLLVTGVAVAVLVGLVTSLAAWSLEPVRVLLGTSPLQPPLFELSGPLPVLYALLGFGVAAVSGLLLRSGLAAVAVAAVVCLAVQVGVTGLREHYTPLESVESDNVSLRFIAAPDYPDGAWIVREGHLDFQGEIVPPEIVARAQENCFATTEQEDVACLRAVGVAERYVSYHPAERFWQFQLTEAAIVLAILAGALGLGLVGLRRRVW
jgi:hypothetical protein